MDHHLTLPPVGWGFMLLHIHEHSGNTLITDGGSHFSCYEYTRCVLWTFLTRYMNPSKAWAWILSHMDYDHYSLVTWLINARVWREPEIIVVPGTYSQSKCREAFLEYHALAMLAATILEIPLPRTIDLVKLFTNAKKHRKIYGVFQGARLRFGELAYHVIWPPSSEMGKWCNELLGVLEKKIGKALEKCREKECREVLDKSRKEGGLIAETIEPDYIVEGSELDIEGELSKEIENKPSSHTEEPQREATYTYDDIYALAAEKLKDPELLRLHQNVVNALSLAYVIELDKSRWVHEVFVSTWKLRNFLNDEWGEANYRFLNFDSFMPLLLYPADLDGAELGNAISYYTRRSRAREVLIEVAAHHGNAYSQVLRNIIPHIIFIPRCHSHPNSKIRKKFRYSSRYQGLPVYTRLITGHSYGLDLHIEK